ncbi:hypothetical protein Cgig2_002446 [Carnegiea gigantea]|uniref:DUF4378 domain-containing protein n=1 Tax=Carnegiea gigantea TaxID=171969 RepID=A0A9Q1KTB6_9CARY|nr:hypothetical protein Cgig2_002446 [Carnegiea gigantea]
MALVVLSSISAGEEKYRRSSLRAEKKPWMLQDYLRDDANSCSSNGFRSFPRRECCAAVKSIIEKEFIRNAGENGSKRLTRSRTISSALREASMTVINAVKFLPFKSPASGDAKRLILPRSFSKKLFKRSFWWKKSGGERKPVKKVDEDECDEIERWINAGVVTSEKYQPFDLSNETAATNGSSTTTRNSNSDGKSGSWSDITFTSDYLTASSENDAVERNEKLPVEEVGELGGATTVEDSVEPAFTKNPRHNEDFEKEQFSPVSVMDFPDNDEGNSSPFTLRKTSLKGNIDKPMKKLGRFETLVGLGLQPINLEGLMSSTLVKDPSPESSIQSCSTPIFVISSDSEEEEEEEEEDEREEEEAYSRENEEEKKADRLLKIMEERIPTRTACKYELDIVLLDYFRENVVEKEETALLKAAEDWLNGHYDRLVLGWEVKDERQAYIRDMEEGGRWPRENKLEKEEVASELEAQVLTHLIEELLLEWC